MAGNNLIDQLAASVRGGGDGRSAARKRMEKERLSQLVSVATQVPISRRVSRSKVPHRDRQEAKRSRGGLAGTDPHPRHVRVEPEHDPGFKNRRYMAVK